MREELNADIIKEAELRIADIWINSYKLYRKGDYNMKKLEILFILMMTVASCSYLDGSEARRRGRECMYNYKGELQGCNYIK
ncbi:hypothetical protein HMPREF1552_02428 [Leptotrichia sp. oral taxon 879 str. F0557]|nr:hypothetical protein HMPREF1552_02428 [Leptotrichia sp. oral taxon 879 str. F0557]